jgi:adenylosuccinate lyase
MQHVDELMNLSPLDGRYHAQTGSFRAYFSEFAYIKYRVIVEIRFLQQLSTWDVLPVKLTHLKSIADGFSVKDAKKVKEIEKITKHDVKAIEYFLRKKIKQKGILPFIHFGLTSEDVNNISYSLMISDAKKTIVDPAIVDVLSKIKAIARINKKSVMLARTHGQPAVPTTFGKELAVYSSRLNKTYKRIKKYTFEGKLNGAVGNYNALFFAYPEIDWIRFSREFIRSFGLEPNIVTTQILPADTFIEYGLTMYQVNSILIGFCQDMWNYISRGLVKQKKIGRQVGSSTMPQKINPVLFENAEGNLQIANSYFELFARKFSVSRLQRDLSDSTVKRSIGTALAYSCLAWKAIGNGLADISFDKDFAMDELSGHWEVLAEAMQIFFKMQGDDKGYEKAKSLMMGKTVDRKTYREIVKKYPPLANLTPSTYIGLAIKIAELALTS